MSNPETALAEADAILDDAINRTFEGFVSDVFWALTKVKRLIDLVPRPLSDDDRGTIESLHGRLNELAHYIESNGG